MSRIRVPIVAIAGGAPVANASMQVRNRVTAAVVPVYAAETGATTLTVAQQVSDAFGRFPGWTDAPLKLEATVTPPGGSGFAPWIEAWDAAPAGTGDVTPPWLDLASVTLTQGLRTTFATRPSPAALPDGVAFVSSDLGGEWIVFGGAWVPVAPMRGTLAARPTPAAAGNGGRYFATDDWGGTEYTSDGAAWTVVYSMNRRVAILAAGGSTTFAGLDGNTEHSYRITVAGTLTQGGVARYVNVRPNNDAVAANYNRGAGIFATAGNNSAGAVVGPDGGALAGMTLCPMSVNGQATTGNGNIAATMNLAARAGQARQAQFSAHRALGSVAYAGYTAWNDTAANIASLVVDMGGGTFTGAVTLERLGPA